MGWWIVAWLAVVATQSILSVHSELVAHADDEHCELCVAAASAGATLPVSLASFPIVVPAAVGRPLVPEAVLLPDLRQPRQPRAPPVVLS
jgi:hypothetical protein